MKLKHDELLSKFAFNVNLRHYTKGKAMCYVSVPPAVTGVDVMGWLSAACGPIEGKGGGGKGGTAQGQGNNLAGRPAAIAAAKAFAAK